ncbi:ABC transporter permease [Bradyrhizobium sp. MOS001]|uniref:ABC transporter permease n=1 Tax=unclassified Bradyrhizobium TaxID=2631580 RepID=UPI0010750AC2|nr:ABC transporter permease [Bradyrhizobium sp. MOS001]TFW53525.1 ABC transporter permease [Bradyrhizobium sp. MOS001]
MARNAGWRLSQLVLRYGLLIVLAVLVTSFALACPGFSTGTNLDSMLRAASIAAIMYGGATWAIASGEIDVSFMQVAAVANMLVAATVPYGWALAVSLGVLAGIGIGLLNGLIVGLLRLPSLIVTIATGGIALSIATSIGRGSSVSIANAGFIGEFLSVNVVGIPAVASLAAVIYGIAWYLQERLLFGHYLYATAQNRRAVMEAGIPVSKIIVILFAISGVTSATAGILLAADLASGQPRIGESYFLDGLTAIFLGALVIRPFEPNALGTLVGVLLLATLTSGTALLGWTDWQQQMLKGFLLLVSLVVVFGARHATVEDGEAKGVQAARKRTAAES